MPRPATGQVIEYAGVQTFRVRIGKERPSFPLAVRTADQASARAAVMVEMATRLRGVASADEIKALLTEAGNARTERDLAAVREAVDAIASGQTTMAASAKAPTFAEFAKQWADGELRRKYPDHVREKDSSRDVQVLRDFINPQIGAARIPDVTIEHAERVMSALPDRLAPRTRKLVAQCMRKVMSLAVYPGRHIDANPIPREWMPKIPKVANKAKSFLYPEEDAKLLSCEGIPLVRRLAYGILDREGMRASELELLKWRDVDLEHGRVRLDENKTDDPRAWALSPDVARTLTWWRAKQHARDDDLVIGLDLGMGSKWLRGRDEEDRGPGDLQLAGVTRPELFERTATRQPFRLHDLRATFVTVSLANGKTEQWVTDRTGHKSSQMLALYTRQARTWGELGLGELEPLDELLPEVTPDPKADWTAFGQRGAPPRRIERPANGLGNRCSIH